MVPQIAPIADVAMQNSGWRQPSPGGQDPNFPQPQEVAVSQDAAGGLPGDTDPLTPQAPMQPKSPEAGARQGIETMAAD